MITSSIAAPPRPFVAYAPGARPALSDSAMISAAFRAGTPNGPAAGPERKVTMPILTGACAQAQVAASAVTAAARQWANDRSMAPPRGVWVVREGRWYYRAARGMRHRRRANPGEGQGIPSASG